MFVRCSGVASPPSGQFSNTSQLSTPSAPREEISAQSQATHPSSSAHSPDTLVSVPVVQVPAISSLVPCGHLQHPAMLNPVFADNWLPSVRPVAVSPSAMSAMPLVPCGVSPQHYADPNISPQPIKLSPVMQPHISTAVIDSTPCSIQSSSAVSDS